MSNNYEELEKISELKEKGIITEEEFAKKKKELLESNNSEKELINQKEPKQESNSDSFTGVKPYYKEEFEKIKDSGEAYTGSWNWFSFLFGPIWALTKGLWLVAIVSFVISMFTAGIGGFIYWFIFGFRGTYMYYKAEENDKQVIF